MNMSYVHVTLIFDPHTIKCERSKSLAFYHRISCFINSKISFFFYKNIVFRTEAGYSYFLADFRLKIFLRMFRLVSGISVTWNFRFYRSGLVKTCNPVCLHG